MNDPNTAMRCELFPGSESPCSLPACATVRALLSAGPPVFPTGSVIRISTTLPEGSSTSAMPVNPGEDGSLQSGLPNRPYKYSESGDLLCTGENLAFGLLPHPIQDLVIARCLELLRLQFRRAVHVRTMNAVPEGLVYHGVIV